jgi:hypothetical protein
MPGSSWRDRFSGSMKLPDLYCVIAGGGTGELSNGVYAAVFRGGLHDFGSGPIAAVQLLVSGFGRTQWLAVGATMELGRRAWQITKVDLPPAGGHPVVQLHTV